MKLLSLRRAAAICACTAVLAPTSVTYSQEIVPPGEVMVVDMVPPDRGAETVRDSEPNVAVNPANPMQIAGSAFTPASPGSKAPIYVSTDGGLHWRLNPILPFNNTQTGTGDITLRFGSSSNVLYVAALKKTGSGSSASYELKILRSLDFTSRSLMEYLVDSDEAVDQPWVQAMSASDGAGASQDRVYVGYSDLNGAGMSTPTIQRSLDAASSSPQPFEMRRLSLDRPGTCTNAGGPARLALHRDGTVYAAFFQFTGACDTHGTANLVVARDDHWAEGAFGDVFQDLTDPTDSRNGRIVAQGIPIPWIVVETPNPPPRLGGQRVTGHISIAVDPSDSHRVFVAWGQGTSASDYALHLRSSSNGGKDWSDDLITVADAVNPSVAIDDRGTVGFLYQALVDGDQWETHFLSSAGDFATSSTTDLTLHRGPFPSSDNHPIDQGGGQLGDYNYLMAVGANFYGVFSGNNDPATVDYPLGITYRRGTDPATGRLRAPDGSLVKASIDPFFFVAADPIAIDMCVSHPQQCNSNPVLAKNLIKLSCQIPGCIVLDSVANNCQVKFTCPGCTKQGLCPPYYHFYLDGMKDVWRVGIFDGDGKPVPHRQFKTRTGVVLSFRPLEKDFVPGIIGAYRLAFEMGPKGTVGSVYPVKARLVRSSRPYKPEDPQVIKPPG